MIVSRSVTVARRSFNRLAIAKSARIPPIEHRPHFLTKRNIRSSVSACSKPGVMVGTELGEAQDIAKVLFTENDIRDRVTELGRQIAKDYADKRPLIVGTLTGAIIFMAGKFAVIDLVRAIDPCPRGLEMTFMKASSYGSGTESSGSVQLNSFAKMDIAGRHVLIVEDIVDTGRTLEALLNSVKASGAASVGSVTLLDKPSRRTVDIKADYVGFKCPNEFVVGLGLDFDERYRSLPYIAVLKPEIYQHILKEEN